MTDNEALKLILQKIYDLRCTARLINVTQLGDLGFEREAIGRYLTQLKELGLIDGTIVQYLAHPADGMIQITAKGSKAIENPQTAPPQVMMDHSINVHGSQNVQIGDRNIQGVTINVEKLNAAIDGSQATMHERSEAKSILKKLSESKLLVGILGKWISGTPT